MQSKTLSFVQRDSNVMSFQGLFSHLVLIVSPFGDGEPFTELFLLSKLLCKLPFVEKQCTTQI